MLCVLLIPWTHCACMNIIYACLYTPHCQGSEYTCSKARFAMHNRRLAENMLHSCKCTSSPLWSSTDNGMSSLDQVTIQHVLSSTKIVVFVSNKFSLYCWIFSSVKGAWSYFQCIVSCHPPYTNIIIDSIANWKYRVSGVGLLSVRMWSWPPWFSRYLDCLMRHLSRQYTLISTTHSKAVKRKQGPGRRSVSSPSVTVWRKHSMPLATPVQVTLYIYSCGSRKLKFKPLTNMDQPRISWAVSLSTG